MLLKFGLCVGMLFTGLVKADPTLSTPAANSALARVLEYNNLAISDDQDQMKTNEQFLVVASPALKLSAGENQTRNWNILPVALDYDHTSHYVGIDVEASRAFRISVRIFTNLGEYVNKIDFSVSPDEFNKLSKGITKNTRMLRILWDNRAQDGRLVGTGAYVLKTTITLLKIPGIADEQVLLSDYRIVGLLRPQ